MKNSRFIRYALMFAVATLLLLVGSNAWSVDETAGHYRIYDNQPFLQLDDTTADEANWELFVDYIYNEGFGIHRIDGGLRYWPFVIENGTPSNLLFLDEDGFIGINTNDPLFPLDMHSTLPEIKMKDTSGGAGEAHLQMSTNTFTIEGNTQQNIFNIDTRANADVLNIDDNGSVGVGTTSPAAKFEVDGTASSALMRVENSSATSALRTVFAVVNNGPPSFSFQDSSAGGTDWLFRSSGVGWFSIAAVGEPENAMVLTPGGNMTIAGTLTQGSSREIKQDIHPTDGREILTKVASLPVSTWNYKDKEPNVVHMGPMAEDFHEIFKLGRNGKGISTMDTSGVALAAIKGLYELVQQKDDEITLLKEKMAVHSERQEQRVAALEAIVARMANQTLSVAADDVGAQIPAQITHTIPNPSPMVAKGFRF